MKHIKKLKDTEYKENVIVQLPFVAELPNSKKVLGISRNRFTNTNGNGTTTLKKDAADQIYYDKFEDIKDEEVLRLVKGAYNITGDIKKSDIFDEDFTAEKGYIFAGNTTITNVSGIGDLVNHCSDLGNATNKTGLFRGCSNLKDVDATDWQTEYCDSLARVFDQCKKLVKVKNLGNLNTSNVTSIFCMCLSCNELETIGNISNWDVSNVTTFGAVFSNCYKLNNIGDLSNWDVSKVTDMSLVFNKCYKLNNIGDISSWDVSKVANMSSLFYRCVTLLDVGTLESWNIPLCTTASYMFGGYIDFEMKIKRFKLDNLLKNGIVTTTFSMFLLCTQLESIGDISDWNMSNVTDMSYMFNSCLKLLNIGDLSKWDVSNVISMNTVFASTPCSNGLDFSTWNTSKVTTMYYMFNGNNGDTRYVPIQSLGTPPIPVGCNTGGMFGSQDKLTTIINAGKISASVSFSDSPLTHDSALKLLNALDSSNTGTLTLSAISYNSLSTTEIAIGTNKGWTIAKA